jgi:hypothetical protein
MGVLEFVRITGCDRVGANCCSVDGGRGGPVWFLTVLDVCGSETVKEAEAGTGVHCAEDVGRPGCEGLRYMRGGLD